MVNKKAILSHESPMEFFMRQVETEAEQAPITVSEESKYYLVNLLANYFSTDHLYDKTTEGYQEIPLAILFAKAMEAELTVKIQKLRRLGDHSLYVSGYFQESLNRKLVDLDYYIQMGGNAYATVSSLIHSKPSFSAAADMYQELASFFKDYVNILSGVADRIAHYSNRDLLKIYDRWLRTKNERDRKLLAEEGIVPVSIDPPYSH